MRAADKGMVRMVREGYIQREKMTSEGIEGRQGCVWWRVQTKKGNRICHAEVDADA